MEVRSAGSLPGSEVHPLVAEALRERGIDLTGAYPKPLTDDVVRAADYVITMGCGDACPVYPGKRYLDWQITDPAEETLDRVRQIVDEIDARVRALQAQL
ncbi:MAG: arsenate reductase ArsC [Citricoccus sp.]|nr:arsenate reductase ArsC [Citricoccus sp. WCRC_4]